MTTKKTADIASLLNRPHLVGNQDANALPPDPVVRTRVIATIKNTVPYDRNPRRTKNPLYDEIKESIQNKGLDHPPIVTRKSPADPYMIKKGGNTRLEILNELWEQTQEARFFSFECDFEPWTSDLDNLISHMVENEMKGETKFIEKAIGAVEIKTEMEAADGKPMSVRELARRITAEGWSINQANLGYMLYAHDHLLPIIPEAFWSGMGRDTVKKIRKLLETCKTFWESVATAAEGSFDDVWKPTLSAMDGEGFDVEKAEYQLCSTMSAKLNSPVLSVSAEVQAIHEGLSKGGNRPTDIIRDAQPHSTPPIAPSSKTDVFTRARGAAPLKIIASGEQTLDDVRAKPGDVDTANNMSGSFETRPHTVHTDERPYAVFLDYEVPTLQELAYQAALDYADTYGIADYVEYIDTPDTWHLGYRMKRPDYIDEKDNLLLPWVLLWSMSNAITSPADIFGDLNLYLTPSLNKEALLIILALLPNFKGQLMGRQIQDDSFEPVRWKTLCELEAIVSLLVDYRVRTPEKLFASSLDGEGV